MTKITKNAVSLDIIAIMIMLVKHEKNEAIIKCICRKIYGEQITHIKNSKQTSMRVKEYVNTYTK